MKKYPWHPDEMVLLIDIFFRYLQDIIEGNSNNFLNGELHTLSETLRLINLYTNDFDKNPEYRNLNGMKMMIQNLRYIYCLDNRIYPYKGLRQNPIYFVDYYRKYVGSFELLKQDLLMVQIKYNLS